VPGFRCTGSCFLVLHARIGQGRAGRDALPRTQTLSTSRRPHDHRATALATSPTPDSSKQAGRRVPSSGANPVRGTAGPARSWTDLRQTQSSDECDSHRADVRDMPAGSPDNCGRARAGHVRVRP